jgi:hypothetical protein
MAELSTADRQRVWRALMRYWSSLSEAVGDVSKSDLQAAVNAADTWIENNQSNYNTALPDAARNNLTATQKTLMFCCVALMRVDPGVAALLRRALGVEVD